MLIVGSALLGAARLALLILLLVEALANLFLFDSSASLDQYLFASFILRRNLLDLTVVSLDVGYSTTLALSLSALCLHFSLAVLVLQGAESDLSGADADATLLLLFENLLEIAVLVVLGIESSEIGWSLG